MDRHPLRMLRIGRGSIIILASEGSRGRSKRGQCDRSRGAARVGSDDGPPERPTLARRMTMASPQTGIFALGTSSHAYLEFDVEAASDGASVVSRVATLREPRTTIGGVNLVAGFRPELWAAAAPDAAPSDVVGFNEPVVGPTGYALPATQHDIVVWLTGAGYDVVFDLSRDVAASLVGQAALAHEMVGWPYHHDLDLTGFIDGTENPTLVEATRHALVPTRIGSGGSFAGISRTARCSVTGRSSWVSAATSARWRTCSTAWSDARMARRTSSSASRGP